MTNAEKKDFAMLYFDKKDHRFLVAALAKGPTGRTEIGEPIPVTEGEFEPKIGEVVTNCLDSFQTNVYSPETARRSSDAEYRNFRKRHIGVSVERPPSGDLIFRPLHHFQSGYVANRGEQIVVRKEDIPDGVPTALREAFALAR
jgi:hypothetical protein